MACACWLVNTGWTGGPFGVGSRMKLEHTRRMLDAVLTSQLDNIDTEPDPVFGLNIPVHIPGVPTDILNPRSTWADPHEYDSRSAELVTMFRRNFDRYADHASDEIRAAGP